MRIVDFTRKHITEATTLAIANYEEERKAVPVLPFIDSIPDLSGPSDNQLGVAVFDGGSIVWYAGLTRMLWKIINIGETKHD